MVGVERRLGPGPCAGEASFCGGLKFSWLVSISMVGKGRVFFVGVVWASRVRPGIKGESGLLVAGVEAMSLFPASELVMRAQLWLSGIGKVDNDITEDATLCRDCTPLLSASRSSSNPVILKVGEVGFSDAV